MTTQNLTTDEVIKAITVAMQRLEWGSGRAALKTLAQELKRSQLEADGTATKSERHDIRTRDDDRNNREPAPDAMREASRSMLIAGARSIGNTINESNHMQRAKACWQAMNDAEHGIEEPKPQNPSTPVQPADELIGAWK